MAQIIALVSAAPQRLSQLEIMRSVIVCGCAIALIAA